jgi:uncharacterized protein YutE (UPF0331/DUF86 family)
MSPGQVSERVVTARIGWTRDMLARIRALPLESFERFTADARSVAAAESYLRRALEALLDLGRHVLAKALGVAATEYKDIPKRLNETGILSAEDAAVLARLAGYRNRMVHFYREIAERELYEICGGQLADVERITQAIAGWVGEHPELVDRT